MMTETGTVGDERRALVASTIAEVRQIIATEGVSRASLERVKATPLPLAARRDLFPDSAASGRKIGRAHV